MSVMFWNFRCCSCLVSRDHDAEFFFVPSGTTIGYHEVHVGCEFGNTGSLGRWVQLSQWLGGGGGVFSQGFW